MKNVRWKTRFALLSGLFCMVPVIAAGCSDGAVQQQELQQEVVQQGFRDEVLKLDEVIPEHVAPEHVEQPQQVEQEEKMFTESGHTVDELAIVREQVESGAAVLLDVREEDEWQEGHLAAATLVPLSRLSDGQIPEDLAAVFRSDAPIYLHCRSGGRVLQVASLLREQGYDLRPLKAGFQQLAEFGFDTVMPPQP